MDTDQTTSRDEAFHEAPVPQPRRRRWPVVLAALFIAATVFGVLTLRAALSIRNDLERGRAAMERGRDQLLAGDAEAAATSFKEGRQGFSAADGTARQPLLRVLGWFPFVGRTPRAVQAIASAGAATADAAVVLSRAVADVPGGVGGLAPANGSIPVERFRPLAEAAGRADALITAALSDLQDAPDSLLLGPVGPARIEAETQVRDLRDQVHAASLLLQGLPTFLGTDGPKRYYFAAQNPAELRGTGGLLGAYSILTIDHGRFRFSRFGSPYDLAAPPLADLPAPNADYAANYNQFRGGHRFWTAINVMPDFPSSAKAVLISYEAATGKKLDGVIVADPFALAALLEATGPVEIPGYGVEIDAGNVVPFTTNQAYSLFHDSKTRKRVLGDAAAVAFGSFLASPSHDLTDLKHLVGAAADRHVLAYSEDPQMEAAFRALPVGGTLPPSDASPNLLSVAVTSSASSKVDYYEQRTIRHTVVLGADGSAEATTDLLLTNHAPTGGQPAYVIGPNTRFGHDAHVGPILRHLQAGESVALVNVYCGATCVPGATSRNGKPITPWIRSDLGVRYVQDYFPIHSGDQGSLHLTWHVPNAWVGNSSGGIYRMTFSNQVTIRPTELSIRIEPPPGMSIVSASSPLRIVDGAAVYRGTPGARLDLEVAFSPPLPLRLWRDIVRFLSTPIIRF